MYKFSIINNNLGISTLYHSVNDSAFLIIIEAIDWNFSQLEHSQGFNKLLNEAFQKINCNTDISEIPIAFATNLDCILKKRNNNLGLAEGLNFTGVSLTKQKLYVCSAGYTRVHLFQEKKLIHITRDHNLVSDFEENSTNKTLDVTFEDCPPLFFSHTRTLGLDIQPYKLPESFTWEVNGNYSVMVCSDKYHKFREPSKYNDLIFGNKDSAFISDEKIELGLFAKIEYLENLNI